MAPEPIKSMLNQLNVETLDKLRVAAEVSTSGESGRAREEIIRAFLRHILPKSFGIDTGFVLDATGAISHQVDIVVYRDDYHPLLEIGGVKHFLVESVVAAIESKAAMDSKSDLHMALENIRSVKRLDRTNRGLNYRVSGLEKGPPVDPDDYRDQVFGALITERSLKADTLADELLAYVRGSSRREWFNLYSDVRGLSALYLRGSPPYELTVDVTEATRLVLVNMEPPYPTPSLIRLASALANVARVSSLIDYKAGAYLEMSTGAGRSWPITDTSVP